VTGLCGPGWNAVTESPTSCSVTVTGGGRLAVYPLRTAGRVVGVGVRDSAADALGGYLAAHAAGPGYAPPVLVVDRPGTLFLVFRGGEMIARLPTPGQVTGLLDTILAGYAPADPDVSGVDMLCGALMRDRDPHGVLLVPRNWTSDLIRHQSRLRRAGWASCPDPHIRLTRPASPGSARLMATGHPAPGATDTPWPARTGPVQAIFLDPVPAVAARRLPPGHLGAQVINWIKRPATASQVHSLAALLPGIPLHTSTCAEFISTIK
jgi:hypothetical protein